MQGVQKVYYGRCFSVLTLQRNHEKHIDMQRKNFAFRFEWFDVISYLAWECRLEVYEATIRYAETGETGELSPSAAEAFDKVILPDFRRRQKAAEYRARRKARLAAEAAAKAAEQVSVLADRPDAVRIPDGYAFTPLYDRPELMGPPSSASPR